MQKETRRERKEARRQQAVAAPPAVAGSRWLAKAAGAALVAFAAILVLAKLANPAFVVTAVGGGRSALLWQGAEQGDAFAVNGAPALRWRSEHGTARLEVVRLTQVRSLEAIVSSLYGKEIKLTRAPAASVLMGALVENGAGPMHAQGAMGAEGMVRAGRVRVVMQDDNAWILCASDVDDGTFARSEDAWRFLDSLAKR